MSTQRKPSEELQFDLVVAGGGLSGLCAAIAAARGGAQVAIVQDRPMFGGNCSSEIRVVPYGCAHSHNWSAETGLPHAMTLEDRVGNHETFFDHGMMNSQWDMTLGEYARREPLLTSFLNTTMRAVDSEATPTGRKITAIHASQMGSEREFIFRAQQFIDATGDGTLGFLAGADWRYGREARHEHGENLAPIEGDQVTMGATITMRARDLGHPVPFQAPPWIEEYKTLESIGYNRKLYHLSKPTYGGYWWLEVCNPFHQIDDNAAIRDELHRHVLGVWNFIKNHSDHKEQAANYALEWIGQIPGKRESRRLMGDVLVTEHDVQQDAKWPDGVSYAGWWIDLHIPGGILNKVEPGERENVDDNYKHYIRVAPFSLPLRAMYSRNVENLWLAGRCYSLTHVALGPVRVQLTLGLQGQAVGTAAAYALQNDLTPRQAADPTAQHIQNIRQRLLRDDARVLGLKNRDPLDLALQASASASSEMPWSIAQAEEGKWHALDRPLAQVLPITGERIETVEVFLRNQSTQPALIVAELQPMERIWDRMPAARIACAEAHLEAGFEGWVSLPFHIRVTPDTPHRLALRLDGELVPQERELSPSGVAWAQSQDFPTGTTSQFLYICEGGPEDKNTHLECFSPVQVVVPAYRHWRQLGRMALCTRVSPAPRPYTARMVNNGCAWPEDLPNLWISDPTQSLPQSCTLTWNQEQNFDTVLLSFDTYLSLKTRDPFSRSAEAVREFKLHVQTAQGWHEVFHATGNYQRRVTARFGRVSACALKLEVLSTNGDPSARVFEMRVYDGMEARPASQHHDGS